MIRGAQDLVLTPKDQAMPGPQALDSGPATHGCLVSVGGMVWAGGQGPLGSRPGAQHSPACQFLQCLNREGLCARLPEKSLFTFACVTEEN